MNNLIYQFHFINVKIIIVLLIKNTNSKPKYLFINKFYRFILNDINCEFDAGVRYYPFKNSFFNIDTRTYNSPGGNGTSVDLDFMGLTLKRLFKKGNIDDNFSVFD